MYRFLLVYMLKELMLQNILEHFQVVMIKGKWVALFHCYYKVMQKFRWNFPVLYVANHEKITKNVLHVTYAILGSTSGA